MARDSFLTRPTFAITGDSDTSQPAPGGASEYYRSEPERPRFIVDGQRVFTFQTKWVNYFNGQLKSSQVAARVCALRSKWADVLADLSVDSEMDGTEIDPARPTNGGVFPYAA